MSVKISDDTTTTYARKKKIAIWKKNLGLSLIFGDVTALKIINQQIPQQRIYMNARRNLDLKKRELQYSDDSKIDGRMKDYLAMR